MRGVISLGFPKKCGIGNFMNRKGNFKIWNMDKGRLRAVFVLCHHRSIGVGEEGVLSEIIEFIYAKQAYKEEGKNYYKKSKMSEEVDLPRFFKADGGRCVHG